MTSTSPFNRRPKKTKKHNKGSPQEVVVEKYPGVVFRKVENGVESHSSASCELTPIEAEVLQFLTMDFLTIREISHRRETSIQTIYKILKSIEKKTGISIKNLKPQKIRCTPPMPPSALTHHLSVGAGNSPHYLQHPIRLHGQEFNVQIIKQLFKYGETRKRCNVLDFDGHTVRLYENSLEIYLGGSFLDSTPAGAVRQSLQYLEILLLRLESELGILLLKPRKQNIKQVRAHFSEVENELSRSCEPPENYIKIETTDDGKLWFTIDNSFNLHEAETVHPETSQRDMEDVIQPFFNDLRDKPHLLPSEIKAATESLFKGLFELGEAISLNTKQLHTILGLLHPTAPEEGDNTKEDKGIGPSYIG